MFIDWRRVPHSSLADVVALVIAFVDDTNLLIIGLLAVFLRHVAHQLRTELAWKDAATYGSCLFLLGYILHLSGGVDLQNDVLGVVAMLTRAALVAYLFFLCIAAPIVFLAHLVVRFFEAEIRRLQSFSKELSDRHRRHQEARPAAPETIPERSDERKERSVSQARIDYEFECQILRSAGLSDDELEAALAQAKQKYLQRLQEALQ